MYVTGTLFPLSLDYIRSWANKTVQQNVLIFRLRMENMASFMLGLMKNLSGTSICVEHNESITNSKFVLHRTVNTVEFSSHLSRSKWAWMLIHHSIHCRFVFNIFNIKFNHPNTNICTVLVAVMIGTRKKNGWICTIQSILVIASWCHILSFVNSKLVE